MVEKRNHPRLEVKLPVTLRYKGRLIPATMLNLSCGGMHLKAENPDIEGGGMIEVIFDLDTSRRDLSMRGRIAHITSKEESTQIGLQFANVFSSSHKAIQEYLRKNLN